MPPIAYKKDIGAVVLRLINGLKHTPQTIAPILGMKAEELEKIIEGESTFTPEVEEKFLKIRGVNKRDFYTSNVKSFFPLIDDTEKGVVIFSNKDTFLSQRMIARGPEETPYYIYADTAMSNLSTFRPEWIKQLYIHDGENADDLPSWAFNKGHFEHQVTYFIGTVNFYWIDKDGKRHVRKMVTGDTNYIVPFVPHTFTTRKKDEGLILAVTYGGAISDSEFTSLVSDMPFENYVDHIRQKIPSNVAEAANIRGGVAFLSRTEADKISGEYLGKSYDEVNLINVGYQPNTKVRVLLLKKTDAENFESVLYDRWGYNIGNEKITIRRRNENESVATLDPGDSFFIKPGTSHGFSKKTDNQENGKLLVIDIKPQSGNPYIELAVIEKYAGESGIKRVQKETTRWF